MSVPSVLDVQHNGRTFVFSGWVGCHNQTSNTVFEFVDPEDADEEIAHIWVDSTGNFVCED